MNRGLRDLLRLTVRVLSLMLSPAHQLLHKLLVTPVNRLRNAKKQVRYLEIGPGPRRIAGFETLNVRAGRHVDYVADAARRLPFRDQSFDLIYASHVIEHIPWYQLQVVVNEWVRLLKSGGTLEVWTPDGLKIAKAFVDAEIDGANYIARDGWYRFNPEHDPCVWANGRIFSYGDGDGKKSSPNWHMAIFSPRYLGSLLERSGLIDIERLGAGDVRGHDHGWINLGMRGRRP